MAKTMDITKIARKSTVSVPSIIVGVVKRLLATCEAKENP